MKVWAGLFGMAVNAWVSKKVDEVDVAAIGRMMENSSSSESSDESLSSISSTDSPPYKRKKQRALRKRARKS